MNEISIAKSVHTGAQSVPTKIGRQLNGREPSVPAGSKKNVA